jgi:DNA-binding MarR family transcriptional regulator
VLEWTWLCGGESGTGPPAHQITHPRHERLASKLVEHGLAERLTHSRRVDFWWYTPLGKEVFPHAVALAKTLRALLRDGDETDEP